MELVVVGCAVRTISTLSQNASVGDLREIALRFSTEAFEKDAELIMSD